MSAEVKSILAELIDNTTGDISIVGGLISAEPGTGLTENQILALETVQSALRTALDTLKIATAIFEA
jgi:hypothetical protein